MSSNVLMTTVPVFAGVDFNIWADILVAWLQATGLSSVLRTDRPDDAEVSTASPLSAEDAAAQSEAITAAQKKQADWDEKNDKAMGSIKLRLSPPVRQKTLGMTTAKEIWDFLKKTYGKPGVSAIYTDFKRATSITIPNDANPSAAIELIRMHFDRVSAAGIPTDGTSDNSITKIANFLIVMFIISKLPPRYEYLINQYTQYTIQEVDTANLDVLQSEIVNIWESRQGAFKGPSGKAQANRLSAVKRKDGNPSFQQQQQQRPSGSSSGANGANGSSGNNKGKGKGKANFRRGGRAGKFEQAKRQGQAHLVHDDMSPMMHTVTVVDTPAAIDTRKPFFMETEKPFDAFFTGTKRAINLARDIGARPSGKTVATLEDVVMSHSDPSSFTPLTPAPRSKRTLTERIYWDNLQSSTDGWGNAGNWNGWNGEYPETQTVSDADMACAQGEDASWNEDTLVNTSELGSVFGTTTTESGAKVSQDTRTPVPLIDRIAADPAAEMTECAMYLGERFQNPEDPLHIYGEPLRAALNTVAPTGTSGTLSLVQRLAAVRSEMPSGSQHAPPNGTTTQSLPSSRVASPTPGTTSTGWEWLTPHLQNEDGRYDELIDWQRDATIGLGGMELPSRAPTPNSMPELRSMSPSLSETSDLEYMSTPPSIGGMSLPTSPVEATWSDGIPSPRPSTPVTVTVNAANNYGWSLDSEPSGLDNGYLSSS
ncbi:hypothetical protein D9758_013455 [Tetrapyrgos nigripes]|uniref:Uncharacterized protein n=1 Tax=Tetrapyrgos nigripes TaxID=182062 RepID=A0A8H5CRI4_9AGAR|nr:hypothetical protein D9758_013455 [Tetrapyrgos nigripes]